MRLFFHLEQVLVELLVHLMALLANLVHLSIEVVEVVFHLRQVAVAGAGHSVFPFLC